MYLNQIYLKLDQQFIYFFLTHRSHRPVRPVRKRYRLEAKWGFEPWNFKHQNSFTLTTEPLIQQIFTTFGF